MADRACWHDLIEVVVLALIFFPCGLVDGIYGYLGWQVLQRDVITSAFVLAESCCLLR